jgi:hypothetical protein
MAKRKAGNTTSKEVFITALAALGLLCAPTASAGPIGFNGEYDYATWTASSNIPGPLTTVSTIDGPQQILTLYEPNGSGSGGPSMSGGFDFSHDVAATGTVSFDWAFNWDIDSCCSGFEFYINSTLYNLADGYPGNADANNGGDVSGSFSAPVNAGDTITFEAFTADNCCGAADTVITNFDAPTSGAPEPASMLLFGSGLLGVAIATRMRRKA